HESVSLFQGDAGPDEPKSTSGQSFEITCTPPAPQIQPSWICSRWLHLPVTLPPSTSAVGRSGGEGAQ
ncbi:MAG: hypothetical protein ACRDTD_04635, partial [Pseudonocardiaceae bacterium]